MPIPVTGPVLPRPFLKWAGGKSRLISQYQCFFPESYDTYYEPFLGGGAIFFHLRPRQSVLADINADLVNVYTCVRDQVEAVIQGLETHAVHHCQDYYYQVRAQVPNSAVAGAARFIYLNKTCFNGLYRENTQGRFNVPMGRYKNPKICDPELLRAVSQALISAQIDHLAFDAVLGKAHGSQDFVYFDPPYYPLSPTSDFTTYSHGAFTAADQIQLQQVFAILAGRGVKVLLSNSDCPFIRELYRDFAIHPIQANRAINSNPQKRGKIMEVLIQPH